ncbi:Histidine kinase [Pseudomonas serboccidentalis]
MDNESLLVHACESLASASIMLADLAVNRVLDNVEIAQSPTQLNPCGSEPARESVSASKH